MGKLFNLKKWLTLPETARHLSIVFGEDVTEADILRLALDGHLKLSTHLVNGTYARPCVQVNIEDIEWNEIPSLDGSGTFKFAKNGRIWQDERGTFQILHGVTELDTDVWDLPLIGGERIDIEHQYQRLNGGPEVTAVILDGIYVASTNGHLYELQTRYKDDRHFNKEKLKNPLLHADNFHPAGSLPEDSVFVVRTEALREFEQSINGSTGLTNADDPLPGRREHQIETILAIIAALEYEPLQIPDGGKAKIKTACLTRNRLFTADGFDHAWKAALSDGLIRMKNHEKFAQK